MPHYTVCGMRWIRNEKRLAVYARDEFTCVYCVASVVDAGAALDHVDPGGGNGEENLVTVCHACNGAKGPWPLSRWLRLRARAGELPEQLAELRRRVAQQTFLPIDRELGKLLEAKRGRGPGSFGALAAIFRELEAELAIRRRSEVSDLEEVRDAA